VHSLTHSIRSGLLWNFGSQIMIRILSLGVGILMARILTPNDFGIVAVAMVVWEMIALLGQLGLGAKLIQQQKNVAEYANATFWLNLLMNTTIALLALAVSPFAAEFYGNPTITPIIQVLAAGFILSAFGNTHSTLLQKKMAFRTLSTLDVGLTLLKILIAVCMLFAGFGFWSLILPELFKRPFRIIALWKLESWRPRFHLGLEYWRDIFAFGKFVFGTTIVRYLNINGDYLIIGKVLGAPSLGLYKFGYGLANWPVENIVWIFGRVMFPAFSHLQNNIKEMQRLYLRVVETLSIVSFPLLIGLLSVADLLIPAVYGEKWRPAVLPLKIIIVFTTVRTISTLGGQILMALGQPGKEFKMNAFQVIPLLTAVYIGSRFGIVGVAVGMSVVLTGFAVWFLVITNKAIDLPIKHLIKAVIPALLSSGVMYMAVFLFLRWTATTQFGLYGVLSISVCLGAVAYVLCMLIFFLETSKKFISQCRQIFASIGLSSRFGRMRLQKPKPIS